MIKDKLISSIPVIFMNVKSILYNKSTGLLLFLLTWSNLAAQLSPPTIEITSPTDNSTIPYGESIQITATASDSNGSVVKVEFTIK